MHSTSNTFTTRKRIHNLLNKLYRLSAIIPTFLFIQNQEYVLYLILYRSE